MGEQYTGLLAFSIGSVEITMGPLGINMRSVVFNMGPIYDQYGVGRTNNRPIEPVRD